MATGAADDRPDPVAAVARACIFFLVFAVTAWLVTTALLMVKVVTIALFVALLLAALLMPVNAVLLRLKLPGALAALSSVVLLIGTAALVLYFVVRQSLRQVDDLQRTLTQAIDTLRRHIVGPPLNLPAERVDDLRNRAVAVIQDALPSPVAGATMALNVLTGAAIVVFVLFFLLKDGPAMWHWVLSWAPRGWTERVDGAGRRAWATLTSYVHGVVVVALIDSVLIGIAMFVMGVPLALSLTLLVFVGAFVPFVGAFLSGALAVAVTFTTLGLTDALVLLAVVLLVQMIEGNILAPLVYGQSLRLHPVVVFVAVSVGGLLAGVVGAVVAVPLVATVYRVTAYLVTVSGPDVRADIVRR